MTAPRRTLDSAPELSKGGIAPYKSLPYPAVNDPHQEFDFYMRRWQVRLFIAGFVLPPILFVIAAMFRTELDVAGFGCAIIAGAFLFTAILIHGWRSVANEQAAKVRRKQRKAAAARETME